MTELFKVGQRVSLQSDGNPLHGTVEAFSEDKKNARYRLIIKDDAGVIHMARAPLTGGAIEVCTVDLVSADRVARRHLNGQHIAMGVEAQLNVLSSAYLQLRGNKP